jgi:pimeloyl-ACP methyl ester carboxylesterase
MESVKAQSAAIADYGAQKDESYAYLKDLRQPVLIVNGNHDIVVATINSYLLQQHAPDAQLILYPNANHGAHFQYPECSSRRPRSSSIPSSPQGGRIRRNGVERAIEAADSPRL